MNDFTKMGNEEIGEFCRATHRKLAKDVYDIAKAIQVVYRRLKGKRGEFKGWRDRYVPYLSKATVYRYLAVAELDPADIRDDEGISDLYRRFHILPAKPPAPTTSTAVAPSATARRNSPASGASDSLDDLISLIASQPGAKQQGLTPTVLAKMPEGAIRDVAKQLRSTAGRPAGVSVGDHGPQVGELRAYIPDEDMTPEEAEDRREMELTLALSVAGDKAKPFPTLANADPKELLAYLGVFGVRPEDIAALPAA
jgi:hypothetical protein